MQKRSTNDFSFERYGRTDRGRTGEQENRESCTSESAPSVRLEPCPQGHGGTEGKRCAYFVDERYLASLGLMALEIRSRIPMQPSPAKPWKLALVFPMQLRGSTIRSLPRGSLENHRLEKINFGPRLKSNRYFFILHKRILYRFN